MKKSEIIAKINKTVDSLRKEGKFPFIDQTNNYQTNNKSLYGNYPVENQNYSQGYYQGQYINYQNNTPNNCQGENYSQHRNFPTSNPNNYQNQNIPQNNYWQNQYLPTNNYWRNNPQGVNQNQFVICTCPKCGANLTINSDFDHFFCNYCGCQIVRNSSDATINAKVEKEKLKHKEKMADKILGFLDRRADQKKKENEKEKEETVVGTYILGGIAIIILLFMIILVGKFLFVDINNERQLGIEQEKNLQQISESIQNDLLDGNYDSALLKANTLFYTAGEIDAKNKWDTIRENYITMINSIKETSHQNNSDYIEETNNNDSSVLEIDKQYQENENQSESNNNTSKAVSYSSNDRETAKNGNSGRFAYKSRGLSYDIYYIIDFDEGYVYYFLDGNGDNTADRVAIESGTLNDVLIVTYNDGNTTWSNGFHFKWKNQPDHLILEDDDHFEWDFYATDLSDALNILATKTIYAY